MGVFGVMALGDENVLPANIAIHGKHFNFPWKHAERQMLFDACASVKTNDGFSSDVLEALRFTRKEIHNFGGDKDQVIH